MVPISLYFPRMFYSVILNFCHGMILSSLQNTRKYSEIRSEKQGLLETIFLSIRNGCHISDRCKNITTTLKCRLLAFTPYISVKRNESIYESYFHVEKGLNKYLRQISGFSSVATLPGVNIMSSRPTAETKLTSASLLTYVSSSMYSRRFLVRSQEQQTLACLQTPQKRFFPGMYILIWDTATKTSLRKKS